MLFVCMCIVYIICSFVNIIVCIVYTVYTRVWGCLCVHVYVKSFQTRFCSTEMLLLLIYLYVMCVFRKKTVCARFESWDHYQVMPLKSIRILVSNRYIVFHF